jgi:hypothetical protein
MEFPLYRTLVGLGSVSLTALILELIRRRKLKEELWLPWLAVALAPLAMSIWIAPWATVARWLGFVYEPALLLAVGLFLSFAMILYLTIVVSTLLRQNLRLAQDVAHLAYRLDASRRDGLS